MTVSVIAAAVVIALLGVLTFNWLMGGPDVDQPKVQTGAGASIDSASDLNPTTQAYDRAAITLGGSTFLVDVHSQLTENDFSIELSRDGQPFDHETYESYPGRFAVVKAAGEECDPPIPLLSFPMHIGDSWTWSGSTSADGDDLQADATVTTSQKSTFVLGVPVSAILVDVDLTIHGKTPIKRELKFYFAKGKGLFRREFGDSSVREPAR